MLKIAWYEIKKFLRNTRWMILTVMQPIIMISLLSLVAYHNPTNIKVIIFNKDQNEFSERIVNDLENEKDFSAKIYSSEQELIDDINNDRAKMAVIIDVGKRDGLIQGRVEAIGNATVPEISFISKLKFAKAIEITTAELAKENVQIKIDDIVGIKRGEFEKDRIAATEKMKADFIKLGLPAQFQTQINDLVERQVINADFQIGNSTDVPKVELVDKDNGVKDVKYFDLYASAILIISTLFITLKISDTSITEERSEGTFERFFVTPYRKFHMIGGKMLAFVMVDIVVVAILILTMVSLTHVSIGTLWLVFLLCLLTALSAAALGIFISTLTYSVQESIQASNILFFSSLIVTGLIFQPESMHPAVKYLTYAFPFTYSIRAMREINLLGMGFLDVWKDLLIVGGFALAFILMAILALRRKAT